MYARYTEQPSSPEFWSKNFHSRISLQERLSLLRLRSGRDPRWRTLTDRVGAGSTVLDVGCGLGSWPHFLSARGYAVTAVDFSFELLQRARSWSDGDVGWAGSRAESLPFRDSVFDALISWGVIEHYQSGPADVLAEFARVLRPGGVLLVTVPLDGPRQRQAIETIAGGKGRDAFYEYYFSAEELSQYLTATGFLDVETRPASKAPHVAAPNLYRWLADRNPLLRDAGIQFLKPVMWAKRNAFHMLLGTGTKP